MFKKFLIGMALVSVLVGCAKDHKDFAFAADANVLSVNTHILSGESVAHFLSGSSGDIADDHIKVGVEFYIEDNRFLEDLTFNHAQLASMADDLKVPITIECNPEYNRIDIRYNGQVVDSLTISPEYMKVLMDSWDESVPVGDESNG